jgi:hypothetical protein
LEQLRQLGAISPPANYWKAAQLVHLKDLSNVGQLFFDSSEGRPVIGQGGPAQSHNLPRGEKKLKNKIQILKKHVYAKD